MRQRVITTLVALICFTFGSADNISVESISLKPGETRELTISLSSAVSNMAGVQFDLTLPEGFSLESYSDDKVYKLSSGQSSDLSCTISDQENNTTRFMLFSNTLQKLKEGELMNLKLKVNSNKALDTYSLTMSNVIFSDNNGQITKDTEVNVRIKVTDFFTLLYKVDGNEYKSYVVEYGFSITAESTPTKEGYTFSGWSEVPKTMPAHDVTVTGSFSVNSYMLTYLVDGKEYKSTTVVYGATITAETTPTKEGYTFSGWSEVPKTMPAHDVTVTGSFSINSYKLTYVVDGSEYKSTSVVYGSTITAETAPTKEGYTFSGWSEVPKTMPARDVTVTGSFSVNKYKLIYEVDGVVYKTISYDYGASITAEATPTKEGYTFSGWSEVPNTMPAHDVTVTGSFSINSYKLTYLIDGKEYKSTTVAYGISITAEATPTREGYTFSGWSEVPKTMPAHDVTVTGSFSINKYKLIYKVDGVVYKTYEVEYGSPITVETEPTKEGHTFSGWSEVPKTMPAHDVTVTGTFSKGAYKLVYKVDGVVYKTISYEYGATITAEAAPTKEGYTFLGWSEVPNTMPAHDVTISGIFTINKYKVVYIVDGVEYGISEIEYGAEVNPIGEPTKEGCTFSGWQNLPEEMPAHDVTVSGTFKINSYKVTFMYGDNVLTTIDVNYGEAIELPESLNSERYTLIRWKDVPGSMPAHDVIIYADYVDGIDTIAADRKDEQYIQMNGMYTNDLKQGLNIIRTKDGKTMKVWVK